MGHGVYLQITGNRGRSWIFRFEREYGGKRRGRHIGLGPCTLVSLADLIARLALRPAELPIGIVTSAVGVPVFLSLLRRRRYVF